MATHPHHARSARGILPALACSAALLLGACSDALVGVQAPSDAPALARGGASAARFGPRYRDSSRPSATGRSGTATLTALSVRDQGGAVMLTLTSGGLADPGSGRGEIAKAQVKVFAADGTLLATINYHRIGRGTATLRITDVPPGGTLQVQANIRGIDGRRTDVVTVTDVVREAPDLDVELAAPGEAFVGVPTIVSAVISEENGDLGTYATCQLFVNGTLQDATAAVWVDAGDAVSCAFAPTFQTTGSHDVQVVVSYDDGTGVKEVTDGATLTAVDPSRVAFTATATDVTTELFEVLEYTWTHPDGSHKAYSDSAANGRRDQRLTVAATLSRPVTWPLQVGLRAASGGGEWLSESILSAAPTPDSTGASCLVETLDDGSVFQLCSTPAGSTFGYTRFGGRVTYRSWGFTRQWDGAGALVNEATWNSGYEESTGGPNARGWSGHVTVQMEVTDAQGTFGAAPTIPLADFDETEVTAPYACVQEFPYWLEGNPLNTCTAKFTHRFGLRGSTSG